MTAFPSPPAHRRGGALTAAIRAAAQFNRDLISIGGGLLAAVPVVATLGIALALGQPVAAVTMSVGAMLVGIAWRVSGGRPPLVVMATDATIMALATFLGCVTGSVLWLHLIVLCLVSASGGLLVGVGNRGGVIGNQAIIAVVAFGRFSEPAPAALGLAGLVLAGGLTQVVFLSLIRWPLPLRGQRTATAAAYRSLAQLAAGDDDASSLPAGAALDAAGERLAAFSLFADAAVMTLRTLVSEGHRMRVVLVALHVLHRQQVQDRATPGPPGQLPVAAALATTREALELAARAILGEPVAPALATAATRLTELADAAHGDAGSGLDRQAIRRLEALAGQVRAIATLAPAAGRAAGLRSRRPQSRNDHPLAQLRADLGQLRDHFSLHSPAGRHAMRLAVVVPLATLLARELPVQRGYWVAISAATVLRPEFGATFTRGTERALGTSLGVALAGAITVLLHPAGGVIVILVAGLAWAGYALFAASFAVGFAFITTLVVFLLDEVTPNTLEIASARLLDTLIGGALGLIVYAVWPTWSRGSAWQALANLIGAERAYLNGVLTCLIEGRRADDATLRPLSRAARVARAEAESSVARSLTEPPARRIDPRRSQGSLGALRRLVQAAHILRLDVSDERHRHPHPGLEPLRAALDGRLAALEAELRTGAAGPPVEASAVDLRDVFEQTRRGLTGDPDAAALLAELDEIVDAANGLTALIEGEADDAAESTARASLDPAGPQSGAAGRLVS
jgi:uncharacterized membrane protein YccC